MRVIRRLPLLAVMAIAAAALAAPAFASAANWTEPELTEAVETGYTGEVHFEMNEYSYGYTCEVEADATLKPGGGGSIDSLTASSCRGTGGLEGCKEVTEGVNTAWETPWSIQVKGEAVDLDHLEIEATQDCTADNYLYMYGGDAAPNGPYPPMVLTPNNPDSISGFTLSGQGEIQISNLGTFDATISGSLQATDPGAYGIDNGKWIDIEHPLSLENSADIGVSGTLEWELGQGTGMECGVDGELTLEPGGKADLDSLKETWCKGSGFMLEGCELKEFQSYYEEMEGHLTSAPKLEFTGLIYWVSTYNEGCYIREQSIETESLTLTPDDPQGISAFTLKEEVTFEDFWRANRVLK